MTPSADGVWAVYWNPLTAWEVVRYLRDVDNGLNVIMNPVYACAPLTLATNVWGTSYPLVGANAIDGSTDYARQNAGLVQYLCAEATVLYTGVEQYRGGTYYQVRGDAGIPFVYYLDTGATSQTQGRSLDTFTNNAAWSTAYPASNHTRMHFYPQADMAHGGLEQLDSYENLDNKSGVDGQLLGDHNINANPRGWNQGIIGKMAGGTASTVRVRITFHYRLQIKETQGAGKLVTMNTDVARADPQAYAHLANAIASANLIAASGADTPMVRSYNRQPPVRYLPPGADSTTATPEGPLQSIWDFITGIPRTLIQDVRFTV